MRNKMGEILRNTHQAEGDEPFQKVKKWDVISKDDYSLNSLGSRKRKIIKAKEAVFSSLNAHVPGIYSNKDAPVVTLLEENDIVKGLEIICTCGEKIIVHFNLDDTADGG